jgi:flotillin
MISNASVLLLQNAPPDMFAVLAAVAGVLIVFGLLMLVVKRYKRCPSNKVLVIYGRVQAGQSSRCLHGGGAFVWPLIQDYAFLSLDPLQIEIPLRGALSMENIRVNVPSVFTVAVGTEPAVMHTAAIRLLGLDTRSIMKQAEDIIFGQLRQVIASMTIQDINRDREKFLESIQNSLSPELEKIGLVLINVNITDITDESGYIEAIGRKAASEAIQQADIDVAQQQRKGSVGVAEAKKEQDVLVANATKAREIGTKEAEREKLVRLADLDQETVVGQRRADFAQQAQVKDREREMRIQVAEAEAAAVTGESVARANMADAEATLKVRQAEAFKLAETRRREADAMVRQAQYVAEAKAAEALAGKIEQEKRAELEAVAKASKAKLIVDAEAEAQQVRIAAEAQAAAIFAKLEAQARGEFEMLAKKAEGLKRIVESCGGAQQAFQMMMLEQLPALSETASKAISNIRFDKIVVWDGGQGTDGKGATANFLQNLAHTLPPMLHMMRDVGGVELPEFFGKLTATETKAADAHGNGAEVVAAAPRVLPPKAEGKGPTPGPNPPAPPAPPAAPRRG